MPEDALAHRLHTRLKARDLLLLLLIDKHRVLRKVAQEMNLSQPAITKALRDLEALFGGPLITRYGNGVKPTELGVALIAYASRFEKDMGRLSGTVLAIQQGHQGVLRVGVTSFTPHANLVAAIQAMREDGFSYRFSIMDGSTNELVEALLERKLDCVIGRTIASHDELDQTVLFEQRAVVVSGNISESSKKLASLDLVIDRDWILPPVSSPMRRAFEQMTTSMGLRLPPSWIETLSPRMMEEALRGNSRAVSILPEEFARILCGRKSAKLLPIKLDFKLSPVALITARSTSDVIIKRLLGALRQSARSSR